MLQRVAFSTIAAGNANAGGQGDMADILDLGRGNRLAGKLSALGSSSHKGAAADIIIFPGVRYERDEKQSKNAVGKKTAGKKKPIKAADRS